MRDRPKYGKLDLGGKVPLHTFIKIGEGYVFLTQSVSVRELDSLECPHYALGIINVHELSIGKRGVKVGFYFVVGANVKCAANFLAVYRTKLRGVKLSRLLDSGPIQLRYRLDKLRIFTQGTDYVLIASDVVDKLKIKLEKQEG